MRSSLESSFDLSVWQRPPIDELVNAATHAFGFMLAVTGALVMAVSLPGTADVPSIVACSLYLASLLGVYAMSTLSHGTRSPKWKLRFRRLDQGAIYLLIAASYTPFSITYLPSGAWRMLLAVIWAIALAGFVSKVFLAHRVQLVSVAPYVFLGWLPVVAAPTLVHAMPMNIFWWMLVGGLFYTVGTLFLIYDACVRHFHAVWHLCVIAGSACHFCGILFSVASNRA